MAAGSLCRGCSKEGGVACYEKRTPKGNLCGKRPATWPIPEDCFSANKPHAKEIHVRKRYRPAVRQGGRGSAFTCVHCHHEVPGTTPGTRNRNHCPRCLWSVHVDVNRGDRAAACGGMMEPIAVWVRRGGEWVIIHRCHECGALRANRIAGDDNELALLSLAVRPLAEPPFRLDSLGYAWDRTSQRDSRTRES